MKKLLTLFIALSLMESIPANPIQFTRLADIIYVMDMSYSMSANCIPTINCVNNEYPGDPYGKRDEALEVGFNYQVNTSPQSKAGYIGFAGDVLSNYTLSPVTVSTGQTQLNDMVIKLREHIDKDMRESGTDYRDALDMAITWLDDPSICPHENKAIIFVSDGRPTSGKQTTAQVNFLKNNNIPVYGIFLGREMGDDLLDLSAETGGISYLVPPSNTDTLETVVGKILPRTFYTDPISESVPETDTIFLLMTSCLCLGLVYRKKLY